MLYEYIYGGCLCTAVSNLFLTLITCCVMRRHMHSPSAQLAVFILSPLVSEPLSSFVASCFVYPFYLLSPNEYSSRF